MNPNPQTPDELAKAVRGALESLRKRRPIFRSEKDFQTALHRTMTEGGFLPSAMTEVPRSVGNVDIVANGVALELKEKSKGCSIHLDGEHFNLKGADLFSNNNLTDSRIDIGRIIRLVRESDDIKIGFVVILTSRKFIRARDKLLSEFHDHSHCNVRLEEFEWSVLEDNGTPYKTNCFLVEVRPKS